MRGYLNNVRDTDGRVQTIFGAVVVGDVVRFYQFNFHGNPMGELVALEDERILDITKDNQAIHDVLSGIARQAIDNSDTA